MPDTVCESCRKSVSSGAVYCPACGQKVSTNTASSKHSGVGTFIFIVIVLIIIWHWASGSSSSDQATKTSGVQPASSASTPQSDAHGDALLSTSISKMTWSKGGFNDVMLANFTITNSGNHAVKDIKVHCDYFAPSGTKIDTNEKTIYENIPPHKSRTIRNFNMGFINSQSTGSYCYAIDLTVVDSQPDENIK